MGKQKQGRQLLMSKIWMAFNAFFVLQDRAFYNCIEYHLPCLIQLRAMRLVPF